jgi:hypothetical protein
VGWRGEARDAPRAPRPRGPRPAPSAAPLPRPRPPCRPASTRLVEERERLLELGDLLVAQRLRHGAGWCCCVDGGGSVRLGRWRARRLTTRPRSRGWGRWGWRGGGKGAVEGDEVAGAGRGGAAWAAAAGRGGARVTVLRPPAAPAAPCAGRPCARLCGPRPHFPLQARAAARRPRNPADRTRRGQAALGGAEAGARAGAAGAAGLLAGAHRVAAGPSRAPHAPAPSSPGPSRARRRPRSRDSPARELPRAMCILRSPRGGGSATPGRRPRAVQGRLRSVGPDGCRAAATSGAQRGRAARAVAGGVLARGAAGGPAGGAAAPVSRHRRGRPSHPAAGLLHQARAAASRRRGRLGTRAAEVGRGWGGWGGGGGAGRGGRGGSAPRMEPARRAAQAAGPGIAQCARPATFGGAGAAGGRGFLDASAPFRA